MAHGCLTEINAAAFALLQVGKCSADLEQRKEPIMSILKVIEVLAESPEGFDQAARKAVSEANKTVRNVRSVYIKEMNATVDDGKITSYRVNAKISFLLEE